MCARWNGENAYSAPAIRGRPSRGRSGPRTGRARRPAPAGDDRAGDQPDVERGHRARDQGHRGERQRQQRDRGVPQCVQPVRPVHPVGDQRVLPVRHGEREPVDPPGEHVGVGGDVADQQTAGVGEHPALQPQRDQQVPDPEQHVQPRGRAPAPRRWQREADLPLVEHPPRVAPVAVGAPRYPGDDDGHDRSPQHQDRRPGATDRLPARLGTDRADDRPARHPTRRRGRGRGRPHGGRARRDRARARPVLRRPGTERGRRRPRHAGAEPDPRHRPGHRRRGRRRGRQPRPAHARRAPARAVGPGAAGHPPGHDRRGDRCRRARQEPPHQGQLRQPRRVAGAGDRGRLGARADPSGRTPSCSGRPSAGWA